MSWQQSLTFRLAVESVQQQEQQQRVCNRTNRARCEGACGCVHAYAFWQHLLCGGDLQRMSCQCKLNIKNINHSSPDLGDCRVINTQQAAFTLFTLYFRESISTVQSNTSICLLNYFYLFTFVFVRSFVCLCYLCLCHANCCYRTHKMSNKLLKFMWR